MRYITVQPSLAWNPPAPQPRGGALAHPLRSAARGAMLAGLLGAACGIGMRVTAPGLLTEAIGGPVRAEGQSLKIVLAPSDPVAPPVCANAQTLAEELVCADPGLAAADQRLALTWREAIAAGVPPWRLRRGQERWLAGRETAAYERPETLPALYDTRIAELRRLAAASDTQLLGGPPR